MVNSILLPAKVVDVDYSLTDDDEMRVFSSEAGLVVSVKLVEPCYVKRVKGVVKGSTAAVSRRFLGPHPRLAGYKRLPCLKQHGVHVIENKYRSKEDNKGGDELTVPDPRRRKYTRHKASGKRVILERK